MNERPLMPCPHCGKLFWKDVERPDTHAVQIECAGCLARGPAGVDRENAMELWNWRASEERP